MSYFPTNHRVRAAMDALKRKPQEPVWKFGASILPPFPRKDLRDLMIAYYCPIVCDGVVRGAEWHKTCEKAADDALAVLEANMHWASTEQEPPGLETPNER